MFAEMSSVPIGIRIPAMSLLLTFSITHLLGLLRGLRQRLVPSPCNLDGEATNVGVGQQVARTKLQTTPICFCRGTHAGRDLGTSKMHVWTIHDSKKYCDA
eukprot:3300230-Amphidinium_carterae.1